MSIPVCMGSFPWVSIDWAPSTTSFFPFPVHGTPPRKTLLWVGWTGSAAVHMVLLCGFPALVKVMA